MEDKLEKYIEGDFYDEKNTKKILADGIYDDTPFRIEFNGKVPVCTIQLDPTSQLNFVNPDKLPLDCHGEFFSNNHGLISWKFNTSTDFVLSIHDGKKWTIDELISECHQATDQSADYDERI